jgi:glycosyltransferase involved in cell wall biosynthesis
VTVAAGQRLSNRFVVLVTCHDCAPYLDACLQSIEEQEHDDLGLLIADDGSQDGTAARIARFLQRTRTVKQHVFVRGEQRRGKAFRVHELMQHTSPDSVIGFLDGDDRLINPHAARRMEAEFLRGAEVAYSNFRYRKPKADGAEGVVGISKPLPPDFDPYRHGYVTSHWFCFRAALFARIPPANFLDEHGEWLTRGCDQCFTLPLLHLSKATRFVPEFLVEYNNDTPWQNAGDGAKAAAAVALVRRRGFVGETSPRDPYARGRAVAADLARRLALLQRADGSFPEPAFYGVEFAAALWFAVDGRGYITPIERALRHSKARMVQAAAAADDREFHWEFVLWALTELGLNADPGLRRDNRRVLNWQLLLAVVDARLGRGLRADIVRRVRENQLPDGTIPDFDAVQTRVVAISDQYHAFATLLADELHERFPTDRPLLLLRERAVGRLLAVTRAQGDPNLTGRGARQLFGYGAAYAVFASLGEQELMTRVLDLLAERRWGDGLFPLCLDDAQQHYGPQPGWHGYNRYFDYLAFLGWCLTVGRRGARR